MHDLRTYSEPDAVPTPDDLKINKLESLPGKAPTVRWESKHACCVWLVVDDMSSQHLHPCQISSETLEGAGGCESAPLLGCGADPSCLAHLFLSPKVKNTAHS